MTSNLTDIPKNFNTQSLHCLITSVYSPKIFRDFEFLIGDDPVNFKLCKDQWWSPEYYHKYEEKVSPFELFKRKLQVGYERYRERIASIITILPDNFNVLEDDISVDPNYGDKIIVLTPAIAKMYYIFLQLCDSHDFMLPQKLAILLLSEKSITVEIFHVQSREFRLFQRCEYSLGKDNTYEDLIDQLITEIHDEFGDIPIYGFPNDDMNDSDAHYRTHGLQIIERNGYSDSEVMIQGSLFKAQMDFDKLFFNIMDDTRRIPYVKNVYKILQNAADYRPTSEALGIDLGTTMSASAVHYCQNGIYCVEPVPESFDEEKLLYSWVAFDQIDKPLCGKAAVERYKTKAKYTVYESKKLLGKRFSEVEAKETWPFGIRDNNGSIVIEVQRNDAPKNETTAEEVASILLNRVKANAQEFTNNKNLTKAVITIPAAFSQRQKHATLAAAKVAGIEVLHFLPEPTAAILSYFSQTNQTPKDSDNIMVFDMGGGTTDISIFEVRGDYLHEIAQHGIAIGGTDFDEKLVSYFTAQLKEKYNYVVGDKRHKLHLESIVIKETLTEHENAQFYVGTFDSTHDDYIHITRDMFEALTTPIVDDIQACIHESLAKAKLHADKVTTVVKVGGGCLMPMILRLLETEFPKASFQESGNPRTAVASGAAIYASSILPQKRSPSTVKNFWPLEPP